MTRFLMLMAAAVLGSAAIACGSGSEGQPQENFTPTGIEVTVAVPTFPRAGNPEDPNAPYVRIEDPQVGFAIELPNGWHDRGSLQGVTETSGDVGRFFTSTGLPGAQDAVTVTCRSFETTPADYAQADASIAVNLGGRLIFTQPREIGGRVAQVIEYDIGTLGISIHHKSAYIQTEPCTWRIDLSVVTGTPSDWAEIFEHVIASFEPLAPGT